MIRERYLEDFERFLKIQFRLHQTYDKFFYNPVDIERIYNPALSCPIIIQIWTTKCS